MLGSKVLEIGQAASKSREAYMKELLTLSSCQRSEDVTEHKAYGCRQHTTSAVRHLKIFCIREAQKGSKCDFVCRVTHH